MKLSAIIVILLIISLPIASALQEQYDPYNDNNPYSIPASQRSNTNYGGDVYNDNIADNLLRSRGGFSFGDPIYIGESIIINVADYQPKQVRESLLDQSNVPVFMYLKGTTLGTLLSPLTNDPSQRDVFTGITNIPRIISIDITMNESGESAKYLAGNRVRYIPPRSDSYSLNNMGAVIVYLKKLDKETRKPENNLITLDMNAKILLDTQSTNLFGINEQDLNLKPYKNLDEFTKNKEQNMFFSGKGYIRAVSIDENGGTFEVYGKELIPLTFYNPNKNPVEAQGLKTKGTFRLEKGNSRYFTFGYTGNPFQDVFQVKLDDIITPTDRADFEFDLPGKTIRKKVNVGQTLYPGSSWHLVSAEQTIVGKYSNDCTRFTGIIDETNLQKCELEENDIRNLAQDFNLDDSKLSQIITIKNNGVKLYHIKNIAVIENNEGDSKTIIRETISTKDGLLPLEIKPPTQDIVNKIEDDYCELDKTVNPYGSKEDIACKAVALYKTIIDKYPGTADAKSATNDLAEIYEKYLINNDACKTTNPDSDTRTRCFNFQLEMLKLAEFYYTKIGLQDKLKDIYGGKGGGDYLEDSGVAINLKKVEKLTKKDRGVLLLKVYNSDGSAEISQPLYEGNRIKGLDGVRYKGLISESFIDESGRVISNKIKNVIQREQQNEPLPTIPSADKFWKVERINSQTSVTIRLYQKNNKEDFKEIEEKDIPVSGDGTVTTLQLNAAKPITTAFAIITENGEILPEYGEESKNVQVTDIKTNTEAYVTIIPGSGRAYTTSNFRLNVPIDPRPFEWTPEMLNSQLNTTENLLKKFNSVIDTLDSVVKTWKKVCLGTFAFVTLKSSLLQGSTRAIARRQSDDFFGQKCNTEVKEKGTEKHQDFDTVSECINYYGDEIKKTTDNTQEALKKSQESIKGTIEEINYKDEKCQDFQEYKNAASALGIANSDIIQNYQECLKYSILEKQYPKDTSYGKYINAQAGELGVNTLVADYKASQSVINKLPGFNELSDVEKNTLISSRVNLVRDARLNKKNEELSNLLPISEKPGEWKALGTVPNLLPTPSTDGSYAGQFVSKKFKGISKYDYNKQIFGDDNFNKEICSEAGGTYINNCNIATTRTETLWKGIQATDESGQPIYVTNDWESDLTPKDNSNEEDCKRIFGDYYIENGKGKCKPHYYKSTISTASGVALSGSYAGNLNSYFDPDGKPYCFPIGNGDYVKVLERFPTGSNPIKFSQVWNVGPNQVIDCQGGGDDQIKYDTSAIEAIQGLKNRILTIDNNLRCSKEGQQIKIPGVSQLVKCAKLDPKNIGQSAQPRCTSVMDPSDCKLLFNACDPVMCPSSRCTLGGRVAPRNVIQSGIIGSTVLCFPNIKEGIVVPLCLTGIDAGLKNLRSLIQGYHDCLEIKLNRNEDVGFCDYIRSVGVCEVMWRETSTLLGITGGVLDWVTGKAFGEPKGGGEYLNFQNSFNNIGDSVNFFTKEYSNTYTAAFLGQSSEEIGTQICRTSVNGKFPKLGKILDQLTEPENPPQFTAFFDEAPYAGPGDIATFGTQSGATPIPAGTLELSNYKVFYHIYSGSGYYGGIYSQPTPVVSNAPSNQIQQPTIYSVYLINKASRLQPLYVTFRDDEQYGSFQGRIDAGKYEQKTVQKVGAKGYNEICVNINGQENCGFGKVSSSFGIGELKDAIASKEGQRDDIDSANKCVSNYDGTKSASLTRLGAIGAAETIGGAGLTSSSSNILGVTSGTSPLIGIATSGIDRTFESSGIIRVCSLVQPTPEDGRWQSVGTCGNDQATGKTLGSCWLDTSSININDAKLKNELLVKLKKNGLSENVDVLDADQSRNILYLLNAKRNEIIDVIRDLVEKYGKGETSNVIVKNAQSEINNEIGILIIDGFSGEIDVKNNINGNLIGKIIIDKKTTIKVIDNDSDSSSINKPKWVKIKIDDSIKTKDNGLSEGWIELDNNMEYKSI